MGRGGDKKKKKKRKEAGAGNRDKPYGGGRKKMDRDIMVFIERAQEFKEEGNRQFQNQNFVGAMEQYAQALKLIPTAHTERVFLHSNRAVCLLRIEPVEYATVVKECTLALDVNPRYKKALLRRAKANEALGNIELALKDVQAVLQAKPSDKDALEIARRLNINFGFPKEDKDTHKALVQIVPEEIKRLKLIYDHDIRLAQMPAKCKLAQLREIVQKRYRSSRAILIKYRDLEGDLVTITSTEELRWAEADVGLHDFLRLYIVEVDPKQDPLFEEEGDVNPFEEDTEKNRVENSGNRGKTAGKEVNMDMWMLDFVHLFRTQLGIGPELHMDLQETGVELCSQALEETTTREDAQYLFDIAAWKFKEVAATTLFNWGNVHMCAARRRIPLEENSSKEWVMAQLQAAYDWARGQLLKAGQKYEAALRIKPDFYEGLLALGQQHFESAKLGWSLALASNDDLETWDSSETLRLFASSEEKIEMGTEIWEKLEEQRLKDLRNPSVNLKKEEILLKKRGLAGGFDEVELSAVEAAKHDAVMRSQINLFWGNILFEHSHVEFELGLPMWEEHLDAAVERFKLAGASPTDVAVVLKNHSSNANIQEGLGFKVDEIVQAWNEMHEAKRWLSKSSSLRLEPLFRRKVPKLHQILEHVRSLCH